MTDKFKDWKTLSFSGGLVTSIPSHLVPADSSPDTENYDPSEYGMLKGRPGAAYYTTSDLAVAQKVRGLVSATNSAGTQNILAKVNTALYDLTASQTWATTRTTNSALLAGDELHFVFFNNTFIFVCERGGPTGATTIAPESAAVSSNFAALGGTPTQGKYIVVHKNRVWVFNNATNSSKCAYCALGVSTDWSTANNAGTFDLNKEDGFVINGAASDGDVLYVSKVAGSNSEVGAIYAIYGDGPGQFIPRKIADVPALNHRCFAATPFGVAVVTPIGVFLISPRANSITNDRGLFPIGTKINKTLLDITSAQRYITACGVYRKQLWVSYCDSGSLNNKILVCDVPTGRWIRYRVASENISCFATGEDGVLYGGRASVSSDIRVLKFNTGSAPAPGGAYDCYWHTPNISFGEPWQDKKLHELGLYAKNDNVSYTITQYVDNVAQGTTITINPSTATPGGISQRENVPGNNTVGRMHFLRVVYSNAGVQAELYGIMMQAMVYPPAR